MGLVSQGGVHSQQAHLNALCKAAAAAGIEDFAIHAFTDGRDTSPRTAAGYIAELESVLETTGGRIASVHGRYYAMDRDNRWERIGQPTPSSVVRAPDTRPQPMGLKRTMHKTLQMNLSGPSSSATPIASHQTMW